MNPVQTKLRHKTFSNFREITRIPMYLKRVKCQIGVNPVPLTSIFSYGALSLQGVQNVNPVPTSSGENDASSIKRGWKEDHPRAHTRGTRWCGADNHGTGLVELLISILIGAVLLLGISSFYLSSVRFYDQSSSQTYLQRQATLIIDEMARRIRFANGLVGNPPSDCPAVPSLKVTQPDLTGFYCFYQSEDGLLERLPDGSDFDLLKGPPVSLTLANLSFTVVGGKRATINFQLNDDRGNTMAFTTDLATQN